MPRKKKTSSDTTSTPQQEPTPQVTAADSSKPNFTQPQQAWVGDSFQNMAARLGWGTSSLINGTQYLNTRFSHNYPELNAMYRSSWLARKIIQTIPADMMKNWITYTADISPEDIDKLALCERVTQTQKHLLRGLNFGRLYGGAVGLFLLDGQEDKMDEPLDLDTIMPGDYKGILIADRWSSVYPNLEIVQDINDPDFGLPQSYMFQNWAAQTIYNVHHSRVIRFTGIDLPYWEQLAEMYWGASVLEPVIEEIKKRDNTSANIAALVFQSRLKIFKMKDLGETLATNNQQALDRLYNVLQAQNFLMSNQSTAVIDNTDEFSQLDYSFTGISEIYQQFMMDLAGATGIPMTKLFGRSPAGMNATGESDLINYYQTLEQEQEAVLRPILDKLMPIICMSTLGHVPDDFDYMFNPVYKPTDEDLAKQVESNVSSLCELHDRGILTSQQVLKEIKQKSDVTGFGTNITDEDIEAASDEVQDMNSIMMGANPQENEEGFPPKPKAKL